MDKILQYTLTNEDLESTAGGVVNLVLRNCVKVTGHEISAAKFLSGGITVDNRAARVSERMHPGQTLRVVLPEEVETSKIIPASLPAGMQLEILYEDEDLVIVNKPAGIVSHPSPGHFQDTMANYLAGYYKDRYYKDHYYKDHCGESLPAAERIPDRDSLTSPGSSGDPPDRDSLTSACSSEDTQAGDSPALSPDHIPVCRLVGRLDKETSGCLVFAKNRAACARLFRQRGAQAMQRTYLAIVHGTFPPDKREGMIDNYVASTPGVLMVRRIAAPGEEGSVHAVTQYRVLRQSAEPEKGKSLEDVHWLLRNGTETGRVPEHESHADMAVTKGEFSEGELSKGGLSLVELHILTGRTHQIRLHMASIGHPLLGDTLYGPDAQQPDPDGHIKSMPGTTRALLHAAAVDLLQPFTGQRLHVTAPMPQDFASACASMDPLARPTFINP